MRQILLDDNPRDLVQDINAGKLIVLEEGDIVLEQKELDALAKELEHLTISYYNYEARAVIKKLVAQSTLNQNKLRAVNE